MSTSRPVDPAVSHAATAPVGAPVKQSGKVRTPMSRRERRTAAILHAQLIACLQRGFKSRGQLAKELDTNPQAIRTFLVELWDAGVIYVADRPRFGKTKRTEVFALNPVPFANPDAPR